jgi:hypothetical protein
MKTILSLLLVIALVSCKKDTTTPTTNSSNNTTDIGLAYVGGHYDNGSLIYYKNGIGTLSDSNVLNSPNFNVDVKYLGNNYVDFTINSNFKLPSYLKHFQIKMKVDVESIYNSTNGTGMYSLDNNMFMDANLNSISVNHLVGTGPFGFKPTFGISLQKLNSPTINTTILSGVLYTDKKGEQLQITGCVRKK